MTPNPRFSPLTSPAAWALILITIVLSVIVDLGSKSWAFEQVAPVPVTVDRARVLWVKENIDPRAITQEIVPPHPPTIVIPNLLHFTLVLNPGAVFGSGAGKRHFFIGFTVIALAFAAWMFSRWTTSKDHLAHLGLGLLIGGGIGNLYDRLVYACVRDFIHPLPGWIWPKWMPMLSGKEVWPYVSNIADLFLLIGIGFLMIHLWRRDSAAAKSKQKPAQA